MIRFVEHVESKKTAAIKTIDEDKRKKSTEFKATHTNAMERADSIPVTISEVFYQPLDVDYDLVRNDNSGLGFRVYEINGEMYPSVTTVMGWVGQKDWTPIKEKVGEEYFERLRQNAINRGNAIHSFFEDLFLDPEFGKTIDFRNNPYWEKLRKKVGSNRYIIEPMIESLLDDFERNLSKVIGIEIPLYSNYMKIAGTADLIGYWNGKLSIIDYKNSRNTKTKKNCVQYFLQCSIYATMLHERFGLIPEQLVLPVFHTSPTESEVFIEPFSNWIPIVKKFFRYLCVTPQYIQMEEFKNVRKH